MSANTSENNKVSLKSWMYISIQATLLLLIIFGRFDHSQVSLSVAALADVLKFIGIGCLLLSIFNLRNALTVFPDPKSNSSLQNAGAYKYVRHPMYTCVILICYGIALSAGSVTKFFLSLLLLALFYSKAKYEESLLLKAHKGYARYMKKTGMFLPKITWDKK